MNRIRFILLASLSLFGAGCGLQQPSGVIYLPNGKTITTHSLSPNDRYVPNTSTSSTNVDVESKAIIQLRMNGAASVLDANTVRTVASDYESTDIGDYYMKPGIAEQVVKLRTCDPLLGSNAYVGVSIEKPLCAVVPDGKDFVVVAIGFGTQYETYPNIGAIVMLIKPDTSYFAFVHLDAVGLLSDSVYKKYGTTDEFGSPGWNLASRNIKAAFQEALLHPSIDLKNSFEALKTSASHAVLQIGI